MAVINPKSQIDKRVDAMGGGGGGTYFAGQGLSLKNNTFSLNIANQADIGGVRIAGAENVSTNDPSAEYGIFKKTNDGFPALRTALSYQKGGFFLGDGFVPELEEEEKYGEIYYSPNGYVRLRIGEGLEFVDNDEAATDPKELKENSTGGRKVTVPRATGEKYGAVKIGQWLGIDENGFLRVNMKPKRGIDISALGEISVLIDDETIKLNDDGKLASIGVTIEKGVVITEADASYLLHEYEEVKYVKGNKIGYAGPTSKIVCQGYVFDSLTPDNYTIGADILYGTSLDIRLAASASNVPASADVHIDVDYDVSYPDRANCYLVCSAVSYRSNVGYYYDGMFGIYFKWDSIHAPNDNFPHGYVKGKVMMPGKASKTAANFYNASQLNFTAYFPFATEAEYNAAVGLTYEPLTLTEVQDTTTEV